MLLTQRRYNQCRLCRCTIRVPIPAIISAFEIAKAHDVTTVLNPAPAKALPNELLSLIDIIVPNETEAELLSGIKVTNEQSMKDNANYFFIFRH